MWWFAGPLLDLELKPKSTHASFVGCDQVSAIFLALLCDALVTWSPRLRAGAARLQLLSVRSYRIIIRLLLLIRHFSSANLL